MSCRLFPLPSIRKWAHVWKVRCCVIWWAALGFFSRVDRLKWACVKLHFLVWQRRGCWEVRVTLPQTIISPTSPLWLSALCAHREPKTQSCSARRARLWCAGACVCLCVCRTLFRISSHPGLSSAVDPAFAAVMESVVLRCATTVSPPGSAVGISPARGHRVAAARGLVSPLLEKCNGSAVVAGRQMRDSTTQSSGGPQRRRYTAVHARCTL